MSVTRTRVAWIACAAAAAMTAVALWILWGATDTPGSKAFVSTPQFLLWTLVLGAQAVVWVLGTFTAASIIRRRARPLFASGVLSARTVAQIAVGALVLFALAALTIGSLASRLGIPTTIGSAGMNRPISPLEHANVKMPVLALVGVVVGVIAIGGMWLVSLAFASVGARRPVRAGSLNRFVGLRNDLNTLLALAGVIVGLAALSSGALREAVLAANDRPFFRNQTVYCLYRVDRPPPESRQEVLKKLDELKKAYPACVQLKFEPEYVLEYGLFFTGLLAIAYAPCFLAMRRAGSRLRNKAYPLLAPGGERFFDRLDERRQLDAFLQTTLSGNANFKAAAAILTPLAGSLLSLVIPT